MKTLPFALLALGLAACRPPQLQVPPPPPPAASSGESATRTVDLSLERALPATLEILLDLGWQVSCADAGLGHLSIRQTWVDQTRAAAPQQVLEGTLLLRSEGPGRTRLRLFAQGHRETRGKHGLEADRQEPLPAGESARLLSLLADRLHALPR